MTNANTMQSTAFHGTRHRSPAWKRWLSVRGYGMVTRSLFPAHGSPLDMRSRFERFARTPREKLCRKHPELIFEDYSFGDRGMEAVRAVDAPSCVLMHLHGGAYFMGTPASYRSRTMRLSYRCNAEVFAPDYRLAPEHPAPAALDDALDAWCELRRLRPGVPMFVSGDSAGGGLAISMMVASRERPTKTTIGATSG